MDLQALFHDKSLFETAITLSHHGKAAAYERMEFLGDRVLGLIVADLLYERFPNEKEGDLARRFTALVREETLAEIAVQIGLPALLKTKENELRHNESVLADVCESILGALYLDQGLEAARAFMIPLWCPLLTREKVAPKDAKSALQELAQQRVFSLPIYTVLKRIGPDHAPRFLVQVEIMGLGLAHAEGASKKLAEQAAATQLLSQVKK